MLCKMGTMVEYGVFGQETTVDWTIISDAKGVGLTSELPCITLFCYVAELTIKGGHCSPYTYPKAISMIENKQLPLEVCNWQIITSVSCIYDICSNLQDIITQRLPLKDIEQGLKLVNSSKESIKVVLLPSQDSTLE